MNRGIVNVVDISTRASSFRPFTTENSIVVSYKDDDTQRKKVSTYIDRPLFISFRLNCLEVKIATPTVYTECVHLHRTMGPLIEKEGNSPLVLLSKTCHNTQKENLLKDPCYLSIP